MVAKKVGKGTSKRTIDGGFFLLLFSFTTTTAAADGQLFPYKSSSIEVEVPMYTTLELCTQSLVYTTKKATESRYYELYYVFFLLVP